MGIEDKEKPYQPADEEIRKGQEMADETEADDKSMRYHMDEPTREELLEGRIPVAENQIIPYRSHGGKFCEPNFQVINDRTIFISNLDVRDGKVLAPKNEKTGKLVSGFAGMAPTHEERVFVAREIFPDEALDRLKEDEAKLTELIDKLETAKERVRRQRQQIMEIKEGKEKKQE